MIAVTVCNLIILSIGQKEQIKSCRVIFLCFTLCNCVTLSHFQVTNTYPVTSDAFEISYSGELILSVPPDGIANTNQPAFSDSTTGNFTGPEGAIATPGYDQEFQKAIEAAADGREVETIKLFKPENSSLGFSVIGLKRENQGEIGIFVQDLQPGGIAAR